MYLFFNQNIKQFPLFSLDKVLNNVAFGKTIFQRCLSYNLKYNFAYFKNEMYQCEF